jgi:TetR/AcrR family transcriptional regulator
MSRETKQAHKPATQVTLLTHQSVIFTHLSTATLTREAQAPAAPARQRRKEARPGELLAAALDLFVEKGFSATRVEEVAQRAGVSKGTLFLYYPTKVELFKAVVRDSIVGRLDEFREQIASFEGSSAELLGHAQRDWWLRVGVTKAGAISKLMMAEAGNFPELARFYQDEVATPGLGLIEAILKRGVDRCEFEAEDLTSTAHVVMAPLIHLVCWQHSMGAQHQSECGHIDPEAFLNAHLRLVLDGLKKK